MSTSQHFLFLQKHVQSSSPSPVAFTCSDGSLHLAPRSSAVRLLPPQTELWPDVDSHRWVQSLSMHAFVTWFQCREWEFDGVVWGGFAGLSPGCDWVGPGRDWPRAWSPLVGDIYGLLVKLWIAFTWYNLGKRVRCVHEVHKKCAWNMLIRWIDVKLMNPSQWNYFCWVDEQHCPQNGSRGHGLLRSTWFRTEDSIHCLRLNVCLACSSNFQNHGIYTEEISASSFELALLKQHQPRIVWFCSCTCPQSQFRTVWYFEEMSNFGLRKMWIVCELHFPSCCWCWESQVEFAAKSEMLIPRSS